MSRRVPDTDSIDELARFWDTHDLTDFEHELEEVKEPVFSRKTGVNFNLKLSSEELKRLKRLAASRGLQEAALIREWVREKLHR